MECKHRSGVYGWERRVWNEEKSSVRIGKEFKDRSGVYGMSRRVV